MQLTLCYSLAIQYHTLRDMTCTEVVYNLLDVVIDDIRFL